MVVHFIRVEVGVMIIFDETWQTRNVGPFTVAAFSPSPYLPHPISANNESVHKCKLQNNEYDITAPMQVLCYDSENGTLWDEYDVEVSWLKCPQCTFDKWSIVHSKKKQELNYLFFIFLFTLEKMVSSSSHDDHFSSFEGALKKCSSYIDG